MIYNYIKIAIRNLRKHKSYSIISIGGLTLGLTCSLAILLYVQDELSYDRYHSKKNRIYRLVTGVSNASYEGIAKVHGPWGPTALADLPEVENMARFVIAGQTLFTKDDIKLYENEGLIADSSVFEVFDFKMLQGNELTALKRPDGIVLTQTLAKKYFGDQNPIGKTINLNNQVDAVVTGIVQDVPPNSHFEFSFLVPMSGYEHPQKDSWERWNQFYTYLLLRDQGNANVVSNKFKDLLPNYLDEETASSYSPFLQPITDIHLRSHLFRELSANSDISYLYIFSAIGILILIISSINFVNLTTARALTRAKEVGVRKSSGAIKSQLIIQYLSESIVATLASLMLSGIVLAAILPFFNTLIGKNLSFDSVSPSFFIMAIILAVLVGLISGGYPAFYLAKQKPAEVLKGKTKISTKQMVRQSLVVIQFAISVFLIVSSLIVFRQLDFIQNKNLGFNPSQLISIPIQSNTLKERFNEIKNELVKNSSIESVSISGGQPGGSDWGIPYAAEGISEDQLPPMRVLAVDHDFVKTFDMQVISGRDFSQEITSDTSAYIINEEAARQLGWDEPLTKTLSMPAIGRQPAPVIGIVKDFHFRSMKEKIGPVLLFIPPAGWFGMYTVKIKSNQIEEGIKSTEKTFLEFDPQYPFVYSFFDEAYGALYSSEKRLSKMITIFTGIGIFIACLGLFGLAAFMTEQRTKEIGIRKVLGASVRSITIMLTKDLVSLVLVGFIIAAPLGYYIMNQWLNDFAYRITISPDVFAITGASVVTLAWLTISYRIFEAGATNPVDSLRSE